MDDLGRTEVKIDVSEAKKCKESRDEVGFCVAPQKPRKNAEKLIFEIRKNNNIFVFRGRNMKDGELFEMHFGKV